MIPEDKDGMRTEDITLKLIASLLLYVVERWNASGIYIAKRQFTLPPSVMLVSTGPISFRLTFVGPILSTVADHTQNTLERLHGEAERFAIYFEERRLVANRAADIVDSVLKLTRASEDETIVLKWKFQFHKLLTLTGATEKILSKLKELKPEIMIIVDYPFVYHTWGFGLHAAVFQARKHSHEQS
ncbi:hypothetical protein DKX38_011990 [Salix brachista]|uniref:Uncharacterized protein n=1 Tax=Salix brachista TaxID=2182728 RepID=A0A5N5M037_9ROSI|nr:hypothetical protein DKX38_011990 [Salix brachista]